MTFIWHLRVDFKYLIREVDNKVLHLVKKKKDSILMSMSDFEKFLKINYLANKNFIVCLLIEKLVAKNINMFLVFGINLQ